MNSALAAEGTIPLDAPLLPQAFGPAVNVENMGGFTGCGKTHVLCQGTALAGPLTIEDRTGF